MLSTALKDDSLAKNVLELVPGWVEQVLKLDDYIANANKHYRYMQQCVILGRGYNYSTAHE